MAETVKDTVIIIDNDTRYIHRISLLLHSVDINCISYTCEEFFSANAPSGSSFSMVLLNAGLPQTPEIVTYCTEHQRKLLFLCDSSNVDTTLIMQTPSFGVVQKSFSDSLLLASVKTAFSFYRTYTDNNYLSVPSSIDKQLFNAMIETVWIIDTEANIIDVNRSVERVLGYTRQEAIDLGLGEIDFYLSSDEVLEMCRAMASDRIQRFETVHKRKDGSPLPVEIYSILIPYDGDYKIVSIARDISERKHAEQEIRRQLAEKETLLRAVHHRMKNHIATIRNLLLLQIDSVSNEEALSILQDAIGRVDCMKILYESLLLTGDYVNISAREYIEKIISSVRLLFPGMTGIEVITDIEEFDLDEKKLLPLGVIIEELLTNVFKYAYSERNEGEVLIRLKKNGSQISLLVKDDGKGLPEGFDIETSNGFGLMIVKMLAKQIHASFSITGLNGTRSEIVVSE